tara:strand:- start:32 stop:247 length:216 start_codon:yes stop_codon:yes gene_type:complete
MIKVSSAPEEPFSINIEYKGYNIIMVGIQLETDYEGDLKIFKGDEDVSDSIGDYEITGEGLKKILDTIDTF